MHCPGEGPESAVVSFSRAADAFDVTAQLTGGIELMSVEAQRPALNVRVDDGPGDFHEPILADSY